MKWLHLSDIHYNPYKDGRSTEQLREKLLKYLKDEGIRAEHLFLTGDYRYAADKEKNNEEELIQEVVRFILDIAKAASIPFDNIHLIPGNHDLTRSEETGKINKIKKNYDVDNGRFSEEDLMFLTERFDFFRKLNQEFINQGVSVLPFADTLIPLHTYHCYPDFSLLYLNTSIVCNSGDERGTLVIGNYDLYQILKKVEKENPEKPIIMLGHHGIDNFRDDEKKVIEELLEQYTIELYLCGDAHISWKRQINNCLEITMGCLTQNRDVRTIFSVGELEGKRYSIEAHEWDANESQWGEYSQFNKRLRKWRLRTSSSRLPLAKVITRQHPMSPSVYFLGHKANLNDIEHTMLKKSRIVLLYGIGGIGKTELCRQLVENYTAITGTDIVKNIGWITYQDTLKNSFYEQFPEIQADNMEEYWIKAKQYISSQGTDLLLIIDNANEITQQEISMLSGLECRNILTSRRKKDRVETIEVNQISEEDCCKLYRFYSQDKEALEEDIHKIINLVAGHALSIELLAKTQYAAGISAKEMFQALDETGFNPSEILGYVSYIHNPEQEKNDIWEKRFIEHMAKIFDISEIKEIPEEFRILQLFSLLAPSVAVPIKTIKKWMEMGRLNDMNSIIRKGWLTCFNDKGSQSVIMHPVISSVVRYVAMPNNDLAEVLIGHVADDLIIRERETWVNKLDILSHAEAIAKNIFSYSENYAKLFHNISLIYSKRKEYRKAQEWCQKALEISERVLGSQHPSTVIVYNNVASIYLNQGRYAEALKWYEKALEIGEGILGKDHPNIAAMYNNIAGVYDNQGKYTKALEWYTKSLEINKKVKTRETNIIPVYNNIAGIYNSQGKYVEALEWYERALKISQRVLREEHPDTITIYNNIAEVYDSQGNYENALRYYQKTLEIGERVLGKDNLSIAATYNNIASIYLNQRKYQDALIEYEKALKIREKILGKNHPDTGTIYNNIAGVYLRLGESEKALEWYQKDLEIGEKILGKDHPSTAATYNNIASVYFYNKNYEKALEWYQKALERSEKVLGRDHPATATTYNLSLIHR
ncbi:MAG: tetratricopeptide repeat protein, partial [Lachnospiraceae bacterium]|nr:tetratricopeptide repeat protein [Lachnospiraceae bacterium]